MSLEAATGESAHIHTQGQNHHVAGKDCAVICFAFCSFVGTTLIQGLITASGARPPLESSSSPVGGKSAGGAIRLRCHGKFFCLELPPVRFLSDARAFFERDGAAELEVAGRLARALPAPISSLPDMTSPSTSVVSITSMASSVLFPRLCILLPVARGASSEPVAKGFVSESANSRSVSRSAHKQREGSLPAGPTSVPDTNHSMSRSKY